MRTKEHRERVVRDFCRFLRQENIQTRHLQDLKIRQIKAYLEHLRGKELELRTMQNSMSALRTVLTVAGRKPFAEHPDLSNRALGIGGASRNGTHRPAGQELYRQAQEGLLRDDPSGGLAAVLALQWTFGLRSLEGLRAGRDTLKRWLQELRRGKIEVVLGTKGGRPRFVTILDIGAARLATRGALDVLQGTGEEYLVIGRQRTLKSAYYRYHRYLIKHGLRGEFSSHAVRYAWAQDALHHYRESDFSDREALAAVAQDLGHGDGRGRYVKQVYYQHSPVPGQTLLPSADSPAEE